MQIRWRFAVGYFCPKNEHISMFPTGSQLIMNKLVFQLYTEPTARLNAYLYSVYRKAANSFFLKAASRKTTSISGTCGYCCEAT